jgi:RNA polymerase sigma-70 factor (ECF subfamily)
MQAACEELEAPPTHASRQERMVVLARRARRGDAHALDELLGLVTDRVSALARRLVLREAFGSALAEEAANSALLAIAQDIRLLRDPEKVGGWMFAIVRRRVAEVVEAESRSLAPLNRPWDDQLDLSSGRLSPESQLELRTLLDQARDELPPRRREIVDLCLERDLKQEDAAATMGCSVGAVKKELHVARAQLKQTLQVLEVAPSTFSLARRGKHRASDRT